jgi:hypothetical protein
MKNLMTRLGIEPASFRLVAQCVNQLQHLIGVAFVFRAVKIDEILKFEWETHRKT